MELLILEKSEIVVQKENLIVQVRSLEADLFSKSGKLEELNLENKTLKDQLAAQLAEFDF